MVFLVNSSFDSSIDNNSFVFFAEICKQGEPYFSILYSIFYILYYTFEIMIMALMFPIYNASKFLYIATFDGFRGCVVTSLLSFTMVAPAPTMIEEAVPSVTCSLFLPGLLHPPHHPHSSPTSCGDDTRRQCPYLRPEKIYVNGKDTFKFKIENSEMLIFRRF